MTEAKPEGAFNNTTPFDRTAFSDPHPEAPPATDLLLGARKVHLRDEASGDYLNLDVNGWGILSEAAQTTYFVVKYYGNHYIVVDDGTYKEKYKGYYLSFNAAKYVGAYWLWEMACFWETDPIDCSYYPGLYEYNGWRARNVCVNGISAAPDKLLEIEPV